MRKINVPLADLTEAIGHNSFEIIFYLDLQDETVIELFDEYISQLTRLVERAAPPLPDLDTIIHYIRQQEDVQDWIQEILIETAQVEYTQDEERFLPLPQLDSRTAYGYMEAFIESLDDEMMQDLLYTAIDGRGAFSRFKRTLTRYPDYRQRWFDFEEEQKGEFVRK